MKIFAKVAFLILFLYKVSKDPLSLSFLSFYSVTKPLNLSNLGHLECSSTFYYDGGDTTLVHPCGSGLIVEVLDEMALSWFDDP